MAKKATTYQVLIGFENDDTGARHEAGTAVSEAVLKKDGFTIKELLADKLVRPLEEAGNGDG